MKLSLFVLPFAAISLFVMGFLNNSNKTTSPTLTTAEGKTLVIDNLQKEFKGKWVLVDFWASWNKASFEEREALKNVYSTFHTKNLEMVSISLDNSEMRWKQALSESKCNWLQATDFKGWQSAVCNKYGVSELPFHVLINPEGKIVRTITSQHELVKVLEESL